jgi:hypothetical protein
MLETDKLVGKDADGRLPLLSRAATPLAAPFWLKGITDDKSNVPYSRAVPVPFTFTSCPAFPVENVGKEESGDVRNH